MGKGEYVRTKHFGINKIKGFYSDAHYDYIMVDDDLIKKEDIIKSSPNIIDLIEVGDYVNGVKVEYIDDCKGSMREYYYIFENEEYDVGHYEEEIQSVVTKEQFEAMEYKLEVKDE